MARALTLKNLMSKKHTTYEFDGIWLDVIGTPSTHGIWLVYGAEKHGKTTLALMLAEYISKFAKTDYVSAEEGTDYDFTEAVKRAQLNPNNRNLHFREYTPVEHLDVILGKRKSPKVMVLDNATIYHDELKGNRLKELLQRHQDKLFILVAHEERGEPYTSTAKLARKLAKVIIRVQGLQATVGGRCPGGIISINEEKAELYHGTAE